jgi:hypothetical protein
MNKTLLILILAVVVILVIGIAYIALNAKSIAPGQSVASQFYSDLESGNIQTTSTLYDAAFLHVTPMQNMTIFLNSLDYKLGNVTGYSLQGWNDNFTPGTTPVATVDLYYNVTRTKYDSQEHIILFKDNNNASYLIAGYDVNSTGLLNNTK